MWEARLCDYALTADVDTFGQSCLQSERRVSCSLKPRPISRWAEPFQTEGLRQMHHNMRVGFHLSSHVAFVWYVPQLVVSELQKSSIFSRRRFLLGRKKIIPKVNKKEKKLLIKAMYYGWVGSRRVQNDPGQLWRPVALSSCNIIQTGFTERQFEQQPHREHSSWIREDINGKGFITAGLNAGGDKKAATSPLGFRPRWGAVQEDVSIRFGMWDKSINKKCRLAQQDLKHLWVLGSCCSEAC